MSKYKNILFRADSSSKIGLGHIMRDLVLASKYKNSNITFATQGLKGNINSKILDSKYNLEILDSSNKKELVKLIKKLNIDLLVIDNYKINYKKERYIKKKTAVTILSFDDTYEKHHCDIVLNHNLGADKKRYKSLVLKKCKLRCGSRYTLLREEFIKEKKNKTVFLAMGGADHSDINIKILKVLEQFNHININLVTTTANKNLEKLKAFCDGKSWIKLHIDSNKIAKLMKESDFAIVTPSVILNEVYFMKLPFIAVKTANNQKDIYKYLLKNNYDVLKNFNKKNLLFLIRLKLNSIKIINFTDLSKIEKKIVFHFRNNKNIRKWMYNKEPINYDNHLSYIDSLKIQKNKIYFLVKQNNNYIGVIDLTNLNYTLYEAELGIYTNPELRGMGNILMKTIINYSFDVLTLKKLKANVYVNNISAISLYERFNFKRVKNYKNMIYMELLNENR